ncbi:GTP:AMP phosphotransferase AK3, mitochondrial-like isoform X1 [Acanthaster planci]|uniref:GTP:AMP phosphotransferase, mitochondrial n=2 Tax=Acanthaster planci TaxID=133434 RepID=A0A8B7ZWQ7_ACAPL|nr:GTP:AMP phosphotransferase AK3, mitochondrial-like isoform X1 [Acanthaster planci]
MISKVFRAIILGPPGSGKGTISSRIVRDFKLKHLSSGDLLRAQVRNQTAAGLKAKDFMEQGALVPDQLMVDLILSELKGLSSADWLLDGFPRTVEQAKALADSIALDTVINLDVPFDVIVSRLEGRWVHAPSGRVYNLEWNPPKEAGKDDLTGEPLTQRDDDRPETVLARLRAYQEMTTPVTDFFREMNKLEEFTGTESDKIWPHVHKFLSSKLPPKG